MLNHIPKRLSPELVKLLMEMGHGDELLLADANYPALTNNTRVVRTDGIQIPELLTDILALLPLDTYSTYQGILMQVVPGDQTVPQAGPPVWQQYRQIIAKAFPDYQLKKLERQEFYQYSKSCFAIVQTGETALYGNLILKKGVVV